MNNTLDLGCQGIVTSGGRSSRGGYDAMNRQSAGRCGKPVTHVYTLDGVRAIVVEKSGGSGYCKRHAGVAARNIEKALYKMLNRKAQASGKGYEAEREAYLTHPKT